MYLLCHLPTAPTHHMWGELMPHAQDRSGKGQGLCGPKPVCSRSTRPPWRCLYLPRVDSELRGAPLSPTGPAEVCSMCAEGLTAPTWPRCFRSVLSRPRRHPGQHPLCVTDSELPFPLLKPSGVRSFLTNADLSELGWQLFLFTLHGVFVSMKYGL